MPKKVNRKKIDRSQETVADSTQTALAKITPQALVPEVQQSYLDYAMSVIISRALPDVRDGLKPVHRRILYAMWTIGLRAGGKFRKSATVVGEVLGKYHPHGDVAVYESMVRMAQDFSMRYPMVNGQGNFGSMDGDSAAAMRYTEAKLTRAAEEMLFDIDKDTVDLMPNYDNTIQEPKVLPSKLPQLLLNGAMGIAVGMATNIPPHNLSELIDGITTLLDNPESTIEDLMKHIKGPDFPTGGLVFDINEIKNAYATGRGGVVIRAKTDIIETKNGGWQIIVNEIPYQVNKSQLLEKIALLVKEKKIEGIKDLRDESNREGVRVVIDLKKDTYPKKILNQLFKHTQLQETFHYNMLALVDGIQPKVLNLKSILEYYILHRQEVVKRRTAYELQQAKDRAHILKGLVIALENIDKIIATIKKSKDKEEARLNLISKFKLSERQAVAILEMRLQQLANLERMKVEQELKEKMALIKALEEILNSVKRIRGVIKEELLEIKEKYGDDRRTTIIPQKIDSFKAEDLIPDEDTIVAITRDGYIKRMPPETFKAQSRGGKGVIGLTTKEEDEVEQFFSTTTHSDLFFFTNKGRVFQLKAYDVPAGSRTAKGQAIVNFLQLSPNEKISTVLESAEVGEAKFLVMVTSQGNIKKSPISEFANVRRSGLIAIKLKGNDLLEWVKPSTGKDEIMLVTDNGQSIRFKETQVRPMGRAASGVRGIRLKKDNFVISMDIIDPNIAKSLQLLAVMENGFGKRTPLSQYKVQGRGGSGIKTAKVTAKTGKIVNAMLVNAQALEEDLIIISRKGQVIRLSIASISVVGRDTQGVHLMRFKEAGDRVASLTRV